MIFQALHTFLTYLDDGLAQFWFLALHLHRCILALRRLYLVWFRLGKACNMARGVSVRVI